MPRKGYDGQVVVAENGSWSEGMVNKSRSSIVFHELAESFERTINKLNYKDAHSNAIVREKNWHKQSIHSGEISEYTKPTIDRKSHKRAKIDVYFNLKIHRYADFFKLKI